MNERTLGSRRAYITLEFVFLTVIMLWDLGTMLYLCIHPATATKFSWRMLLIPGAFILIGYASSIGTWRVLREICEEKAESIDAANSPPERTLRNIYSLALRGLIFLMFTIGVLLTYIGHLLAHG